MGTGASLEKSSDTIHSRPASARSGLAPLIRPRAGKIKALLMMALLILPLCLPGNSGAATLSVQMAGSGQGSVNSSPPGIACPGSCSGNAPNYTLYPNPGASSFFSGWGGACAGLATCSLTLAGDQTVTAFFDLKPALQRVSGSYFGALQAAYNNLAAGGKIQVVASDQSGDLLLDDPVKLTVEGGYDNAFSSNAGKRTRLHGKATVRAGSFRVKGLALASSPLSTPPPAPAGLKAVPGDGKATLTWDAVQGATSYALYYRTSSGVTRMNGTRVAGAVSGQTVAGLTNDTPYYFVITALGASGESLESAPVRITPAAPPPPVVPAAPSGLTASAADGHIALSWQQVPGATSYTIYWSNTPGVTKTGSNKITGIAKPPYLHEELTNDLSYHYIVTASNDGGESAASQEASAKPTLQFAVKVSKTSFFNTGYMLTGYVETKYDSSGLMHTVTNYGATGLVTSMMTYEYDAAGRPSKVSTTIPGSPVTMYTSTEYNEAGKPVLISSYTAFGTTTFRTGFIVLTYDTKGNLTRTTTCGSTSLVTGYTVYQYNEAGKVSLQSDYIPGPDGDVRISYITTEYNQALKPVKVSYFNIAAEESKYVITEYNEAGREAKVTTYNALTGQKIDYTVNEYDSVGNRIKVSKFNFNDMLTGYTTTRYSSSMMPEEVTVFGPTGLMKQSTLMSYQAAGAETKESIFGADDVLTGSVSTDYNGAGKVSMVSTFDAAGALTKYTITSYDAALRATEVASYDSTGLKEYSTNEYDAAGRLTVVKTFGPDDVLTKSTVKEYTPAGVLSKETSYDAGGAATGYTSYEYNAAGKVTKASVYSAADVLTKVTTYEYDAAGRRIKSSKLDGAGNLTEYVTTQYNAAGKPERNSTFDAAGHLKNYSLFEYAN